MKICVSIVLNYIISIVDCIGANRRVAENLRVSKKVEMRRKEIEDDEIASL